MSFQVTPEQKNSFKKDGYILVRGLLNPCEVDKIKSVLEKSEAIHENSFGIPDDKDRKSRLCVWSLPGNDVTGMLARSRKVAGTAEQLLEGDVYHYHSKLMMKEARTGGSFVWHQDYGYWYQNGILLPNMLSVFIALDEADRDNGCLEVLEGSHLCGRIEHTWMGGQVGADADRVGLIQTRVHHRYIDMKPGDALFFHCNLLHKSNVNNSDRRRWAIICAYNRLSNNSCLDHHHPPGQKLDIGYEGRSAMNHWKQVNDSAIMDCKDESNMTGKCFMDPNKVKTIKMDG